MSTIKQTAKKLQGMGTGGDDILAHITQQEAAGLKAAGGSGKKNPKTGLLSFGGYEGGGTDMEGVGGGGGVAGEFSDAAMAELAGLNPAEFGTAATEMRGFAPQLNLLGQYAGWAKDNPVLSGILGMVPNVGMLSRGAAALGRTNAGWSGPGMAYNGEQDFMGNENGGADLAMSPGFGPQQGMFAAPQENPIGFTRPAFIPKFGKPRGLLGQPQIRGLLGGS